MALIKQGGACGTLKPLGRPQAFSVELVVELDKLRAEFNGITEAIRAFALVPCRDAKGEGGVVWQRFPLEPEAVKQGATRVTYKGQLSQWPPHAAGVLGIGFGLETSVGELFLQEPTHEIMPS